MSPEISLPTATGPLRLQCFNTNGQEGVIIRSDVACEIPFLRIHSSCLFSESFKTIDCDCSSQLSASLEYIKEFGGLVIYIYQEGRGIGLFGKISSIYLEQTEGISTAEAFEKLGFCHDPRNYDAVALILTELGIDKVILATSNPKKEEFLTQNGIAVVRRISLPVRNDDNATYIDNKVKHLKHYENN